MQNSNERPMVRPIPTEGRNDARHILALASEIAHVAMSLRMASGDLRNTYFGNPGGRIGNESATPNKEPNGIFAATIEQMETALVNLRETADVLSLFSLPS